MVDVRPFYENQEPVEAFLEVFKYALKFSELSLADNWEAFTVLTGSRLLFSFGVFWGVKVPESMSDEPLDGLPYVSLFFRYFNNGYHFLPEGQEALKRYP